MTTGSGSSRGPINLLLLLPLLASSVLIQLIVPMLRIGTSYKALDLGLSPAAVGILSAAFALAPVLFAVAIGRYSDRHGEAPAAIAGAVLVLIAALGLLLAPGSFELFFLFTCLLGLGQILQVSALQILTTHCSGPADHDRVLGYFMIAVTSGQILGPLVVGITTPEGQLYPSDTIFVVGAVGASCLCATAACILAFLPRKVAADTTKSASLRQVLAAPGIAWVILASSLAVTANDLVLVYFPVTGALAGIDAATVGWLLTIRSVGALVSRLFFTHAVATLGRLPLLVVSLIVASAATAALAVPLPVWQIAVAMAFAGIGFGLSLTAGLSLTLRFAPDGAKSTALSLRLTASRFGQFAIPLVSATLAAATGVGAIFAVIAVALFGSAALLRLRVRNSD